MTPEEIVEISRILEGVQDPVVVNLGAYQGEDHPIFAGVAGDPARLTHIMVEPDPGNCAVIRRNVPLSEKVVLVQGAIYSEPGHRQFWRSLIPTNGQTASGSILKPTGVLVTHPQITWPQIIEVDCFTLDELYEKQRLDKVDLLWVDIQGAEVAMIRGGQKALAKTRFCIMEADEDEIYEGQLLRKDLIALMDGWIFVRDLGYDIMMQNTRYL